MTSLKAKIKVIEEVDLYDLIPAIEMCLVSNVVVPKKFCVPKFIKYNRTQILITHLKSHYNKMLEVVHNKKTTTAFFFRIV